MTVTATTAMMTGPAQAAGPWQPQEPPLSTRWTDEVGPDNALPEYPRPRMAREQWQSLNGVWEFAGGRTPPGDRDLDEKILVPYPPESALSGIQRHDDHLRYRRTFTVPPDWQGQRLLLHFGAVDQKAEVQVNGQVVAVHEGGYTGFTADITDAIRPGRNQDLVVTAEDRNEANPFPVGKQRSDPGGIFYTSSSGIWQSVWLEPVPQAHITDLKVTPDLASESFAVTARTGGVSDQRVEAVVSADGAEVARVEGDADSELRVPVPRPRLWSPDDPFLYDLKVRIVDPEGQPVDEVSSYAGMRSIGLVDDEQGRPRMALNGEILFQHGPLDQGYWPDGIYTAPTDDALRFDLEETKRLGFNMVRKHAKVEPERWYYWADRLGLLVWQDMPSLSNDSGDDSAVPPPPNDEQRAHYQNELTDLIDQFGSTTSIVTWVPFNEGWGEFDTAKVAERVKSLDPTRLVDANSGVNCCDSLPDSKAGDIYDDHTYVGPGRPEVEGPRATADGEYGGLGLVEQDHVWPGEPNAYEMTTSRAELTRRYSEISDDLAEVVRSQGLSAAIYTQTTDVENEVNGFFSYDREVLKPDLEAVREHNEAVIAAGTP